MAPQVSAIIPFLNSARHLPEALASVDRQTFTDWEIVLVDGGSSDGSEEMASELEAKSPDRVRVLRHEDDSRLPLFSARVWGARAARAPLLALLDSDDEWHPQFLERHYAVYRDAFADHPGMVFCPAVYWWEDPARADRSHVQPGPAPGLHRPPDLTLEFLEDGYAKSPCTTGTMIHRDIVVEASHLASAAAENLAEDQYLWSHVALNYPVYVSPEPLARYRRWSGSVSAQANTAGKIQAGRLRHLDWLQGHLAASYDGPGKHEIVRAVRSLAA
jgi:glycosyltransferase involved in cell wall biosynthesis